MGNGQGSSRFCGGIGQKHINLVKPVLMDWHVEFQAVEKWIIARVEVHQLKGVIAKFWCASGCWVPGCVEHLGISGPLGLLCTPDSDLLDPSVCLHPAMNPSIVMDVAR